MAPTSSDVGGTTEIFRRLLALLDALVSEPAAPSRVYLGPLGDAESLGRALAQTMDRHGVYSQTYRIEPLRAGCRPVPDVPDHPGRTSRGKTRTLFWGSRSTASALAVLGPGAVAFDLTQIAREPTAWPTATLARIATQPAGLHNPCLLAADPGTSVEHLLAEADAYLLAGGRASPVHFGPEPPLVLAPGSAWVVRIGCADDGEPGERIAAAVAAGVQVVAVGTTAACAGLSDHLRARCPRLLLLADLADPVRAESGRGQSVSLPGAPARAPVRRIALTADLGALPLEELLHMAAVRARPCAVTVWDTDRLATVWIERGSVMRVEQAGEGPLPAASDAARSALVARLRDLAGWERAQAVVLDLDAATAPLPQLPRVGRAEHVGASETDEPTGGAVRLRVEFVAMELRSQRDDRQLNAQVPNPERDRRDRDGTRSGAVAGIGRWLLAAGLPQAATALLERARAAEMWGPFEDMLAAHLEWNGDPVGAVARWAGLAEQLQRGWGTLHGDPRRTGLWVDATLSALVVCARSGLKAPLEAWSEARHWAEAGGHALLTTPERRGVMAELAMRAGDTAGAAAWTPVVRDP